MANVAAEDVEHMKSRVDMFFCRGKVRNLKDTTSCPHCMCKWICEAAAAHDRNAALQPVLPLVAAAQRQPGQDATAVISGLAHLVQAAMIPPPMAQNLEEDLRVIGAVDVAELTLADWQGCNAFRCARPLEQRRLLNALPVAPVQ